LKAYYKSLEINRYYAEVYNNIGLIYYELKNYNEAIINMNKAITLNPYYEIAMANLGVVYIEITDYELAEKYFIRALEINSANGVALGYLSNMYFNMQKYNEAMQVLELGLHFYPNDAEIHRRMTIINDINQTGDGP
jgi:tetratricopeptide (TPR) repeat protein